MVEHASSCLFFSLFSPLRGLHPVQIEHISTCKDPAPASAETRKGTWHDNRCVKISVLMHVFQHDSGQSEKSCHIMKHLCPLKNLAIKKIPPRFICSKLSVSTILRGVWTVCWNFLFQSSAGKHDDVPLKNPKANHSSLCKCGALHYLLKADTWNVWPKISQINLLRIIKGKIWSELQEAFSNLTQLCP